MNKYPYVEEEEIEECYDCEGTGMIVMLAYQSGGNIIDEQVRRCPCTLEDLE